MEQYGSMFTMKSGNHLAGWWKTFVCNFENESGLDEEEGTPEPTGFSRSDIHDGGFYHIIYRIHLALF
jgi:hypothetical protein